MDEAGKLGRGHYLDENDYRSPIEIMKEHLEKVMEIINELGLEPMMWDDMFFTAINMTGESTVDMKEIPESVKRAVPKGLV